MPESKRRGVALAGGAAPATAVAEHGRNRFGLLAGPRVRLAALEMVSRDSRIVAGARG